MRSIHLPTMVVDNFFESPDVVREFALGLEYHKAETNRWPGERSLQLSEIAPVLFKRTLWKIINLIISDENYKFDARMSFQLVDKSWDTGWVHHDFPAATFTAIIYLTPDGQCGTSLYVKNNPIQYEDATYVKEKLNSYKTGDQNINARSQHNSEYTETINVKGLYNRMFLFESHNYHAAHTFFGDSSDNSRLTLVAFIDIGTDISNLPIPRSLTAGGGV